MGGCEFLGAEQIESYEIQVEVFNKSDETKLAKIKLTIQEAYGGDEGTVKDSWTIEPRTKSERVVEYNDDIIDDFEVESFECI